MPTPESSSTRGSSPARSDSVGSEASTAKTIPPDASSSAAANSTPATHTLLFDIGGMTCANCVNSVRRLVNSVAREADVRVNLADASARVVLESPKSTDELSGEITAAVAAGGYSARLQDSSQSAMSSSEDENAAARARFLSALALTLPAALAMWTLPHGAFSLGIQGLLAAAVQLGPGRHFYVSAWRSLRIGTPNMDVLVALGTSVSYASSLLAVLGWLGTDAPVYFETAAFLVTFVSLGKWLEARARGRARQALFSLLDLTPEQVTRKIRNGAGTRGGATEERVAVKEVQIGDRIVIGPGDRIATDGVIRRGRTTVDESMLTGESLPVDKDRWDEVVGGTINRTGQIEVEVTATGAATVLAGIVRMVREAQGELAPIQRVADRVSAVFVPIVIGCAVATALIWMFAADSSASIALRYATAVVVIACPCALGLATPTAILVASGIGLRHGILLKNGAALELLGRVRHLLLDKTGTLTQGEFQVVEVDVVQSPAADTRSSEASSPEVSSSETARLEMTENELLRIAATIERGSSHPLARGVTRRADQLDLPSLALTSFEEVEGRGIKGELSDGRRVWVGRPEFLAEAGLSPPAAADHRAGLSRVCVAIDGRHAGTLWLADELKPDALACAREFQQGGVTLELVSGDSRGSVQRVADTLGIEHVHAEVFPGDKQRIVREARRQSDGAPVGMVGDGLNDAPALALADVGIAIGSGTDAAKETGGIVLMQSRLQDLVRAWKLSKLTLRCIRQNLVWAFLYNLLGLPIAAGAFAAWGITLRPEYAGLAMALSSVSVVSNSLLLVRHEHRLWGSDDVPNAASPARSI